MEPKNATICVLDHGLFISWAAALAPYFKRTLYYVNWQIARPTSRRAMMGDGFEGFERVLDFWDHYKDIDLFVVPDLYFGPLVKFLRAEGKMVWGSGSAEEFELNRVKAKDILKSAGLPVGPYKVIIGLDRLRAYLEEHDDVHVKVSRFRGDAESFHCLRYDLIKPRIDELEHSLGARGSVYPFIVEEGLKSVTEPGWDGISVDGRYPRHSGYGFERKNLVYLGRTCQSSELPKQFRQINDRLAGYFQKQKYRGWLTYECMVSPEDVWYPIDMTIRAPQPPSELLQELYSNWPEVIVAGAQGDLVDLKPAARYGGWVAINSSWAERHTQAIYVAPSAERWVKLVNACRIKDTTYIIPDDSDDPEIGSVVAIGDSIGEVETKLNRYASKVEGFQIDIKLDAIPETVEAIRKSGLDFGPLPKGD